MVDCSGSMGVDGRLDTAKGELLKSLEQLASSIRFQVIPYNRHAEPLRINGQSGLTFATAEHKRTVAHLLEDIHAEGGTDHAGALKRALSLGPEVIFFLTDADDLRAEDIRNISLLNHGRSVIHAIGFGRGGSGSLNALAQTNQGIYRALLAGP
ncbi:MAG TPA: vWA domain-containing protein [Gemmataceae bacterium]|nr:vWA domain-containing protein [Gemmataceae bacterium]